jgi:hypothetical protein
LDTTDAVRDRGGAWRHRDARTHAAWHQAPSGAACDRGGARHPADHLLDEFLPDPEVDEYHLVTRTRAVATDPEARRRFRLYWAPMSSGIILIRYLSLPMVERAAERRASSAST